MNQWRISEALSSCRKLEEHIQQLTDAELEHCSDLERKAARRKTILERLFREFRRRAREKYTLPKSV
jgi:4-alpha-glucanotransferase